MARIKKTGLLQIDLAQAKEELQALDASGASSAEILKAADAAWQRLYGNDAIRKRVDELTRRVEQLETERQPERKTLRANTVLVHDVSASVLDEVERGVVSNGKATEIVTRVIEFNREHAIKRLRLPDYDEVCMASEMFGVNEIEEGMDAGWGSNYDAVLDLCKVYKNVIFYTDQDGNAAILSLKLPRNISIYVF
jgi:hypothetical protein